MFEYCISRGKGTLVELGEVNSMGEASEVFDEHLSSNLPEEGSGMAIYNQDGEIRHVKKGAWSMTTMPKGHVPN